MTVIQDLHYLELRARSPWKSPLTLLVCGLMIFAGASMAYSFLPDFGHAAVGSIPGVIGILLLITVLIAPPRTIRFDYARQMLLVNRKEYAPFPALAGIGIEHIRKLNNDGICREFKVTLPLHDGRILAVEEARHYSDALEIANPVSKTMGLTMFDQPVRLWEQAKQIWAPPAPGGQRLPMEFLVSQRGALSAIVAAVFFYGLAFWPLFRLSQIQVPWLLGLWELFCGGGALHLTYQAIQSRRKQKIELNRDTNSITLDGVCLCGIEETLYAVVSHLDLGEDGDHYFVSVLTQTGDEHMLVSTVDKNKAFEWSATVAGYLGKPTLVMF